MKKNIKKILIAHRAEIACRILTTIRQLGLRSVLAYSEIDAGSMAVSLADESYCLGSASAQSSYLNQQAIIDLAKETHVDAIHPGYGFLSENADFARLCEENEIIFIGPSSDVIELMGNKHRAKCIMGEANIPIIPGYQGDQQTIEYLYTQGCHLGFPLMIKASAGGGGKGMRLVHDSSQLKTALESAKREALSSFGCDELILESYLPNARHIEVQILCDDYGQCWYLQDRECSIQRRHQKILEEAPAPRIKTKLRQQMAEAALTAARTIGYQGVGTIEFLLNTDDQFYFMEMNTRLQVEHAVTEMIYGIDLVAWQIKIAAGEKLPTQKPRFKSVGHAIEVRICAEDPLQDFVPATGKITYLKFPKASVFVGSTKFPKKMGLRIDSGIKIDDEITPYYDSLLAKIIVWGNTREIAIRCLQQSLNDVCILGVKTNLELLYRITEQSDFLMSHVNTNFITQHCNLLKKEVLLPQAMIIAAGISVWRHQRDKNGLMPSSPWLLTDGWRSQRHHDLFITFWYQKNRHQIVIRPTLNTDEDCYFFCRLDHQYCYQVHTNGLFQENFFLKFQSIAELPESNFLSSSLFLSLTHSFSTQQKMNEMDVNSLVLKEEIIIFYQGEVFRFSREYSTNPLISATLVQSSTELNAPMPGIITEICVEVGQQVQAGEPLIILEAMKMEHIIYAPTPSQISEIFFKVGDQVSHSDILVSLKTK